jgi:hypothetical protein
VLHRAAREVTATMAAGAALILGAVLLVVRERG